MFGFFKPKMSRIVKLMNKQLDEARENALQYRAIEESARANANMYEARAARLKEALAKEPVVIDINIGKINRKDLTDIQEALGDLGKTEMKMEAAHA